MKKLTHLTRISLLLAVFFALDKGLGIFRQVYIARQFVLPDQDAFNVANNVPDLISALIAGGALTMAFLPVLSSSLTKEGKSAAWDLFSRVANLAFLATTAVALVVSAIAWPLVSRVTAPGLGLEQQKLVVELMRLDLIATVIFSISGLVMAGLQANQHFLLPAIAPLLYNLGQIFGAVILAPQTGFHLGPIRLPGFGMGVYGLVYGVILGAMLHLLIQVPALIKYKFRWAPKIGLNYPVVKEALSLLGPRILTMLFIQAVFIIRDAIGSFYGQGAISSLTYGWMILQVPETLIGTAIATALLPTISEQIARNDWQSFRQTIERAVQTLLAITLPIAAILSFGLQPLVALAFGSKFQGNQMATLMGVTRAFLAGLAGQSCLEIAARAFYAQKNAKIPLLVSGVNVVLFVGFALLLCPGFGVVGIALAISLAYTGEAVILFYLLNRKLSENLSLRGSLVRGLLAAVVGGALVWVVLNGVPIHLPAYILSVIGLVVGTLAALPLVWRESRLLFKL